jgi:hypothetical protein
MKKRLFRKFLVVASATLLGMSGLPGNSANAQAGDTTFDIIGIAAPLANQTLPSLPVTISGLVADSSGVASVGVGVYRTFPGGGQWWNGTTWQATYFELPANLSAPGQASSNWNYSFTATNGGYFNAIAVGRDTLGNAKFTALRPFSTEDTISPSTSVVIPGNNQVNPSKPIGTSGIAFDNQSIYDVQIVVYRAVSGGQYWNGSTWQSGFVGNPATVNARGATASAWSYSFNPPQNGGTYYMATYVLDSKYNYFLSPFRTVTLADTVAPTATITQPAAGSFTGELLTKIEGTATDNGMMSSVQVALYRIDTAQFWNGTAWTSAWATFPGTLQSPGALTSNFGAQVNALPNANYLVGALPVDGNNNYSFSGWTQFKKA